MVGIVEMHGGVIGAMSEGEGFGTEFYFDIPLKANSKWVRKLDSVRRRSQKHSSRSPEQSDTAVPLPDSVPLLNQEIRLLPMLPFPLIPLVCQ